MRYDIDIENVYEKIKEEHSLFLDKFGVKMPLLRKPNGEYINRALQLVYLRTNLGKLVHRDEITEFVRQHSTSAGNDQQPRHLKYDGWDVRLGGKANDIWIDGNSVPNGYNGLLQVQTPAPDGFSNILRSYKKNLGDWKDVLQVYGQRCAMCHSKTGRIERGHKNPLKGDSINNLIPLCSKCNNWCGKDIILNDDGRVCGLAGPRIVLNSPEEVQECIFRKLKTKFI